MSFGFTLDPGYRALSFSPRLSSRSTERIDLLRRQATGVAEGQVAKRQAGVADPPKLDHGAADRFEHPPHLTVPTLVQDHLQPGVFFLQPQLVNGAGRRRAVPELHTAAQAFNLIVVEDALDLDVIALHHAGARMHERMGHRAVVRDQQQPLGVIIEPADGIEPAPVLADEIHHRRAPLRVADGGDDAVGLVEHEVDRRRLKVEELAVHLDMVALRIGLGAQLGDDPAVDGDAAVRDQRLRLPARRNPCLRDEFLKAYQHRKNK